MMSIVHLTIVLLFPAAAIIGVVLALRGLRRARGGRARAEQERGAPTP